MIINVLDYLEGAVINHPHKVGFADQEHQITFHELMQQAKSIGSHLAKLMGGQRNKPIIVMADRQISSIISFLGVLYSGNFYVPVDSQMPKKRLEIIFNNINPDISVILKNDDKLLTDIKFAGRIVLLDDAIHEPVDEETLSSIRAKTIDTDPVYAVFTSGSTGIPKGVLINHRSVIDLVEQFTSVFQFSEKCIFANQAPLDYDGSVKDIYCTLKNGASMHIIPKSMFSFPIKLIHHMNELKINTIIWATSALRIIANLNALEKEKPSSLEKILFTGEVMPNRVLNYFRKHYPAAMFVNLYGPTEITCNCTYFIVDRPFEDGDSLPIGRPFPNTEILVINEKGKLVENDEEGEICVRGTSLALGYYNNPQETSRHFQENPLNPFYPEKIYRTGDIGKYNERGELMFISRKDSQIKHMGYRIELGEIEVAANSLGIVDIACCLYDQKNEKIVLFYQLQEMKDKEILLAMRELLPKYMLPTTLVHLPKMPLKDNLKIDRVKLREDFINGNRP